MIVPTYQYACTNCDHRFDIVQSFSDDALTTCPECSGRLRKLYGSVGVVFKGSGFYRTDSRANQSADKGPSNGSSGKPEPSRKSESATSASTSSSSTSSSSPSKESSTKSSASGPSSPAAKAS